MIRTTACLFVVFVSLLAGVVNQAEAVLVSHWRFDEGSGQEPQDSVGTNHGTLGLNNSAGTDDPTWVGSGKIGTNSLNFDGSNDFVNIGSPASLNVTAVTMAAWVSIDSTKRNAVMDKSSNNSSGSGLHMRVGISTNSDDLLRSFVGNVSPTNFADSTNPVPLAPMWTHVAMTSNNSTLQIYINGVLEDSVNLTSGIVNNSNDFRIGASQVLTSQFLDGRIDDAGFWNNPLTTPQVRALYTLGDNTSLNYDLSQAQELFDLHVATSGETLINGKRWIYATGLSTGLGDVTFMNGAYFLQLSGDGSGVMTIPIPEPNTGLLLGIGGVGLILGRRRKAHSQKIHTAHA